MKFTSSVSGKKSKYMKQAIACHNCAAVQPANYQAGDHCTSCGDVVREDVRCGWCTKYVPNQKFCRECGFEMVEPMLFGVARMLKNAGIDQLSIPGKVAEMAPDQIGHYKSLYNRHYAILQNRVEEIRLCEKYLTSNQYSEDFENEYISKIPFNESIFNSLGGEPQGPFQNRPEKLAEIQAKSPNSDARVLALLASFYNEDFPLDEGAKRARHDATARALNRSDQHWVADGLAAMSHWSNVDHLRSNHCFPVIKKDLGNSLLKLVHKNWSDLSALAKTRIAPLAHRLERKEELSLIVQDEIEKHLELALESQDPNLNLSAAVAAQKGGILYQYCEKNPDSEMAKFAANIISELNLPKGTARLILSGNEDFVKIAFEKLYEQQNNVFSRGPVDVEIGRAVMQYLQKEEKPVYQKEGLYIVTQLPDFAEDVAKLSAHLSQNSPDVLLETLHGSNDDEVSKNAIKELLRFDLDEKILKVLKHKSDKVGFGEEMIAKLVAFRVSDRYDRDEMRSLVLPAIHSQICKRDTSTFYMLKALLNELFLGEQENIFPVMKYLFGGTVNIEYIHPLTGLTDKFMVDLIHFEQYFGDPLEAITGYFRLFNTDDRQRLAWCYRTMWLQWEEGWFGLAEDRKTRESIVKGWTSVLMNANLFEPTRGYSAKILLRLKELFEEDELVAFKLSIENPEKVSTTGGLIGQFRELNA